MRFLIDKDTFSSVVKVSGRIAQKDTKMVITLGGRDLGEKVLCLVRVTTPAEEIQYQLTANKPDEWDSKGIKVAVNANKFISIAESVISFGEDVYLEPEGALLYIGCSNKAKTSLPIEAQMPEEMKDVNPLYAFRSEGSKLASVLKKGCSFASENVDLAGYLHMAILRLDVANNLVKGYSTNGNVCARAVTTVQFLTENEKNKAIVEKMRQNVAEYCKAKGIEEKDFSLDLRIPHDAVTHLISIVEDQKMIALSVDANIIQVQVGNVLQYNIAQGVKSGVPAQMVDVLMNDEPTSAFGIDSALIDKSINFINKNNSITGSKCPVRLELGTDKLSCISGEADQVRTECKFSSSKGENIINLKGAYISSALSVLNKGGVVVNIYETPKGKYATFLNGTMGACDSSAEILIMHVNVQSADEPAEEEISEE